MVLIFDVTDGNPNGDPDADNQPRIDIETNQGLVTDVCQKRKVRDYVANRLGMEIFFKHQGILNNFIDDAHRQADAKSKKSNPEKSKCTREWLCKNRYDIRTFGAVLDTGEKDKKAGQVRGAVQCTFARSIDPILYMNFTITRKSVTTNKEAEAQIKDNGYIIGTMGRKSLVLYGLYKSNWFVNPALAHQTGFSKADFKILCDALLNMWEDDHSASRGMMTTCALYVFEHDATESGKPALGKAPSHLLLESVKIEKIKAKQESGEPARQFSDYAVTLDKNGWTEKVNVYNLVDPADYARLFGK